MIEASKTAEISSQPRKRGRRAWLITLAVVVAVVTIALLAIAPRKEPVKVWFVRATNEAGVKRLVFEGTNGAARGIEFSAGVVEGDIRQAKTLTALHPVYVWTDYGVAERTNFHFSLNAPSNDVPYYVAWGFRDMRMGETRWGRFRMRCHGFLLDHNMYRLAERLEPPHHLHIIPSTEIKE